MAKRNRVGARKSKSRLRAYPIGLPGMFPGDNPAEYDELLLGISSAVSPKDAIEEIGMSDALHYTLESLRWRKIKTRFLCDKIQLRLASLLTNYFMPPRKNEQSEASISPQPFLETFAPPRPMSPEEVEAKKRADKLAGEWASGDAVAADQVREILVSMGQSLDSLIASVFMENIEIVQRIDDMLIKFELQRERILREIDRHRLTFGQVMRNAIDVVERENQLKTTANKILSGKKAA
jgi:hypothetical protein